MSRNAKIWLIALGVAAYGLFVASVLVTEGAWSTVIFTCFMATVTAMAVLWIAAATSETRRRWDQLRNEGLPVTAVAKGYNKHRVLFEIQLPDGPVGRELYPSYEGGIDHAFVIDACATGRPLEVLYLAGSKNILIKHPRTGKYT